MAMITTKISSTHIIHSRSNSDYSNNNNNNNINSGNTCNGINNSENSSLKTLYIPLTAIFDHGKHDPNSMANTASGALDRIETNAQHKGACIPREWPTFNN